MLSTLLQALFSYLGSPALVAQLRQEIAYLHSTICDLESERKELLDRLLEKRGVRPVQEQPPLPPPSRNEVGIDLWKKEDIERELAELEMMAQKDPEIYGPLLDEARLQYSPFMQEVNGFKS